MSVCCLQQLCRRLLQQLQLIIPPRLFSLQQKKKKYLIHIKTFCFVFFSFAFCKYFYFCCRCVSENGDVSASLGFCSLLGFFVNKNSFLNCFFLYISWRLKLTVIVVYDLFWHNAYLREPRRCFNLRKVYSSF